MPRPLKFHTQKPARRKASPGGEAGSPLGLTDEVEAKNYHHKLVQTCYLRPHSSRAEARDTFPSRGRLWSVLRRQPLPPLIRPPVRVATFPQGKAFLRGSAASALIFTSLISQPGGRGMPRPYGPERYRDDNSFILEVPSGVQGPRRENGR